MVPVPLPTEVLEWSSSKHHAEDESYSEFFLQVEDKIFFSSLSKARRRFFIDLCTFSSTLFQTCMLQCILKFYSKYLNRKEVRTKVMLPLRPSSNWCGYSNTLMKQGFFLFPRPFQRRDEEFCRQLLLITVFRCQDEDFSPHFSAISWSKTSALPRRRLNFR